MHLFDIRLKYVFGFLIIQKPNAAISASNIKKRPTTSNRDTRSSAISSFTPVVRTDPTVSSIKSSVLVNNEAKVATCLAPNNTLKSPSSSRDSVSLDETMSSCDSMKSPDFEYVDNVDSQAIASLERKAKENLLISESAEETGTFEQSENLILHNSFMGFLFS